ncbi:PAS domain-containing protein [Natronomonas salina]|uniref:ATP-binding protein n=1 Tax=Natronomonas salina TaxID=1710540 RepID=UPI0015B57A76|nr:ATP-binding protein [Natronomonas salina]QLD89556.1 PAS domain-containing protein [Natronomonas salina]
MSDRASSTDSRVELLAELEDREGTLQQVSDVIANTDQPFIAQVEELLAVVREAVGTEYATFSFVDDTTYVFEALDAPTDVELEAGTSVPLSELPNCKHVIETEETLVIEDVEADAPELADSTWGIACYLGTPVYADDGVYGTFCFYGMNPRDEEFSEWDVTVIELLSNWLSAELERREREQSIRDAKLQMEAAAEAGAVGTWEWSIPDDEFVTGPSFAKKFGVDPDAAREGVSLERFVSSIHEEDRERVERKIDAAVESCGEYEAEYRVWNEAGERRWVLARGHVECADDGTPRTFPGALIDITERKKDEQLLKALNDRLRATNERLENFAHAASHDLQEPLRMVSTYLQLLETRHGDELSEEAHEFLGYAVDGADRMREMVDSLLAYSRVEGAGSRFTAVDLNDVIADVQTDLQQLIEESEGEVVVEELPCVEGDVNQLRQVFQNLLENAIQYSGDDPPHVHISVEAERESEVVVSISDEGIGIDSDDQDRIFDVFERLHPHGEHRSTGIGLALCERIVERHGGEIWVESEPGEGSTFFVSLST